MKSSGSPLFQLHDSALLDLQDMLGDPKFSWDGVDYPCAISSLQRGTALTWGGTVVDIKFSIIVRTRAIAGAARPLQAGVIVAYDGAYYRVVNVRKPAPGAHLHLDVIDKNY